MTEPLPDLQRPFPPSASRRGERAVLLVIAAIAITLRFIAIGRESLWFDEGWTWWMTGLSPAGMFDVIRGDVVAPLSFYLLKGWRVCVSDVSEVGLRMPSAIYATLTLVPFYILVRATLQTRLARLAACVLMACSFMQLQYTREARPYALLCLATIAALACVPTMAARRSWPAIIGFALFTTAGLYTHNLMLFYGVALGAAWFAWPGERPIKRRIVDMAIAGVIIAACYAPWLPILRAQFRSIDGSFWAARPGWPAARVALAAVAGVDVYGAPSAGWALFGQSISSEFTGLIAAMCVAVSVVVAFLEPPRRRLAAAVIGFTIGPFLLILLASQVSQPVFMERAFIASSAVMPILFALPLDATNRWRRRVGGAVVLLLAAFAITSAASLFAFEQKEDWRGAYAMVAALPPSKSRVVVFVANEGELPFDFYSERDHSRPQEFHTGAPHGFFGPYPPRTIRQVLGDADLVDLRQTLATGVDDVVLVLSHDNFSDPGHRTETFLRSWGDVVDERKLHGIRVLRFRSGPLAPVAGGGIGWGGNELRGA